VEKESLYDAHKRQLEVCLRQKQVSWC
jgi:hypothetical protein